MTRLRIGTLPGVRGLLVAYTAVAVFLLALGLAGALTRADPSISTRLAIRLLPREIGLSLGSAVAAAGASPMPWALVVLDYAVSALNLGFGFWLGWSRPDQRVARLLALGMVGAATSFNAHAHGALLSSSVTYTAALNDLHVGLHMISGVAFLYALLVFPDGSLVPRRADWLVIGVGVAAVGSILVFHADVLFFVVYFGFLIPLVGLVSLGYRRGNTRDHVQRQQIGIVLWSLGLVLVVAVMLLVVALAPTASGGPELVPLTLDQVAYVSLELFSVLFALLPVAMLVGIMRYRLFGVRIITRALVYGALTVCILGLYASVIGGLEVVFGSGSSYGASLLAAATVAFVFQPLRERLQRSARRVVYGEGDEPYRVLARLGARLEASLAPETVLPIIVRTVRESLKLPYAAIVLVGQSDGESSASSGSARDAPVRIPLRYQHELQGELLVASRQPGEPFTPAERRLLEDLGHQAGVATHAVRLTSDLQHARRRLVHAAEEERRRLRRDLHDGLGPTLASQVLLAGTARRVLATDPATSNALLAEIETDLQRALADLRGLVYNLRPPALDELGLVGAIRARIARLAASSALAFEVHLPCDGPCVLPAAVEVAALRIVDEALTNVLRHARARTCRVRLEVSEALEIEVVDDGVGLQVETPGERPAGVGLSSIRDRAAELGGAAYVERVPAGGTRVIARLPLASVGGDQG
jgi:signal transduction histidine kinase